MLFRTFSAVSLAFAAALATPVGAHADEIKTVDECIQRYIQAIGGQEKLDSIKSALMHAKNLGMGGIEMPLVIEYKAPNKVRTEIKIQGMTVIQAIDGDSGWFVMPLSGKTEPEKMSDDMFALMSDGAELHSPLVNYKKKGHKVELLGKDEIEGSEVYKIKVLKKGGAEEIYYLDAEHFIPIKVRGKRTTRGTVMEYEISLGNYKPVDGVLMAHSIEQSGGPQGPSSITFQKIEFNVEISDDRFTMPKTAPQKDKAPD